MLASMKYLILIALFVAVFLGLRRSRASRFSAKPHAERAPERMVKCAFCGVNQPISESVVARGRYFCSAAHRQEAENAAEQ